MLAALELENPELAPDEAGYITLKAQLQKVGVPSRLLSRLDEAREALKQAAMESIDVDSWDSFQFSEVLYKVKAKDKKVDEASEVSQRTVREGKKAKTEMLKSDLVDMGTSKVCFLIFQTLKLSINVLSVSCLYLLRTPMPSLEGSIQSHQCI